MSDSFVTFADIPCHQRTCQAGPVHLQQQKRDRKRGREVLVFANYPSKRAGLIIRRALRLCSKRYEINSLHEPKLDCAHFVPNLRTVMRVTSHIPKRLLRTKEAALYLGMSPGKLRRLTQSGELPIIQHDEHSPWLYDLQDLDNHIEKSKHRFSDFP